MPTRVIFAFMATLTACSPMTPSDAGVELDAGRDASVLFDAGGVDAGAVDAGAVDAGGVDAGGVDAGAVDAGFDAGPPDAGYFEQLDAGPGYFAAVWTDGNSAWIVGLDGLILHRSSGAWSRIDAGSNDLLLTVTVDGLGRVHVGGRGPLVRGVTLLSEDGGESFVTVRNGLSSQVSSLAADQDRVFAATDVMLFLDGGEWDRSMPQPSMRPGALAARGGEIWATGFSVVHHFVDGGWREESTGGELGHDVCTSLTERTLVSEHGFTAAGDVSGGWTPWLSFNGEPLGCDYAPDGTLWIAGNRIGGGTTRGIVRRWRTGNMTEWVLPPLRGISVSDGEVLVIGADDYVGRLSQP